MMEIKTLKVKNNAFGIFWIPIISGTLFLYETLYTRIISAVLLNNYVFLIISLSVVGYGLGSSLYYSLVKKYPVKLKDKNFFYLMLSSLFFSIFIILAFIYFIPFISLWIYIIPVSFPFIITGFIYSSYYDSRTNKSQIIFSLDLVGAVVGLIGGYFLMNTIGIIETAILIGLLSTLVLYIFAIKYDRRFVFIPASLSILFLYLLFSQSSMNWINNNFNGFYSSPYTSFARFADAGTEAKIIATKWDAFSRTDVLDTGADSNLRTVIIDGAANASMIKVENDSIEHMYLKDRIDFLPYLVRKPENAAIIGAGGGRDVLQALHGGVNNVDAIEINKSSIDLTNQMQDYNGSIFSDERVNIKIIDGRSFLKQSEKKYDIIFLSMVMTGISQAANMVTAETYIYTKEAVATYIDKLTSDGELTFVSHDTQDMIKILRTIRDVLIDQGLSKDEIKNQIMIVGNPMSHGNETMVHNPVIMYSPKKYSNSEVYTAKRFINRISAVPLLMKDIPNIELISSVIDDDNLDLPFNFEPATDERPYFYHLGKGLPGSLSVILIIALLATFILWAKKITKYKIFKKAAYFSLTGMAFMMIEIILIQKMTLILGHPTLAFLFIVSLVLSGAGMGSLISSKKIFLEKKAEIIAGILLLIGTIFLYKFKNELLAMTLYNRLLMIGPYIFVTSFFQGIIFPSAIKQMKEYIPIYYGINSSFSLIGSVSALILIFLLGSTAAMFIGSSIYIILFFIKPYTIGKIKGE